MTELTVQAVAMAYRRFVLPSRAVSVVVASGGGARNLEMMRRLAAAFAPAQVATSDTCGLSADYKEAIAFALLASARIDGRGGQRAGGDGGEAAGAAGQGDRELSGASD